jgi:hypothetical protein
MSCNSAKRGVIPVLTNKTKIMYTEKQINEGQTAYKKESLTARQSTFVLLIIVILGMFAGSCSRRYSIQSNNGECGAWYPKKCKIGSKNW